VHALRQVDIEHRCDPDEAVCDLGASSESNVRNFTLKTMGYDAVNDSQQARGAKPVSNGRIWKSMRPQFLPKAQIQAERESKEEALCSQWQIGGLVFDSHGSDTSRSWFSRGRIETQPHGHSCPPNGRWKVEPHKGLPQS
jgi:hypothetical protein